MHHSAGALRGTANCNGRRHSLARIGKRNEGRPAGQAAGRRFGPKLDEHQQAEALRRLAGGESFQAIAWSYRVSHTTISRGHAGNRG